MTPTFQYYKANIKQTEPLGILTLPRFIQAIRQPRDEVKDIFNQIHKAELAEDWKLKADLKTHLYSFTPAVYVIGKRRYADIHNFTGLLVLDFDHLPSQDNAKEFRNHIFNEYGFIVATWLSASGLGVRALVRIPVIVPREETRGGVDEYQAYFNGLAYYEVPRLFKRQLEKEGIESNDIENFPLQSKEAKYMRKKIGFDMAPKNAVLPMFLSWDSGILSRSYSECEVWSTMYVEPDVVSIPLVQFVEPTYRSERRLLGMMKAQMGGIVDEGHLIVRSTAFRLGGYVGGGEIDFGTVEGWMYDYIDSHGYLRQKAATYKKTVTEMLKRGMMKPLQLEK